MLDILQGSYYEHMKAFNETARFLPIDHPKRVEIREAIEEIKLKMKPFKK